MNGNHHLHAQSSSWMGNTRATLCNEDVAEAVEEGTLPLMLSWLLLLLPLWLQQMYGPQQLQDP